MKTLAKRALRRSSIISVNERITLQIRRERAALSNLILHPSLFPASKCDVNTRLVKLLGNRLFAVYDGNGIWYLVKCCGNMDIYLRNDYEGTEWDAYLVYPHSRFESIVVHYRNKFLMTDMEWTLTDMGLEAQAFQETVKNWKSIKLEDETVLSILSETIKMNLKWNPMLKNIEKEFQTPSFVFSENRHSAYELLVKLCCKITRKINRQAITHRKIIKLINSHVETK